LEIKRGDVVVCVFSREYGKPRPALVVQSDLFNTAHASLTLCPITSTLRAAPLFRLDVAPSEQNGLKKRSQIAIDKMASVRTERVQKVIGSLTARDIQAVDRALKLWLALD
jgi:mRNA interferase MazF